MLWAHTTALISCEILDLGEVTTPIKFGRTIEAIDTVNRARVQDSRFPGHLLVASCILKLGPDYKFQLLQPF